MSKEDGTINLSDKKVKFWTDLINNETGDKKRALSRNLEQKVDDNVDNKFNSMLKELKLLKPYQNHETSCRELEDFKNQKDLKEKSLEDKKKVTSHSITDLYNRQAKIHNWENILDDEELDITDVKRTLMQVCRDELFNEYKKTTDDGKLLQEIDNRKKAMLVALNQPRLKFKEVDFNDAMSKGFEAIGIVYTSMDIKQLN
jgi:hypothetical protein|tara:strand:+ start:37 stop:639 length:603 start_codon:yes stop_codon:yes gene_type:complete